MRILTFQHKDVLKEIDSGSISYPTKEPRFNNAIECYKRLVKDFNIKYNSSSDRLFFGWSVVFEDKELVIDTDHIYRCGRMSSLPKNGVALLLEIPDNLVMVTSFYNYVTEMYAEEFPEDIESNWDSIYNIDKSGHHEMQVVFPFITRDMIIDKKYLL